MNLEAVKDSQKESLVGQQDEIMESEIHEQG